MDVEQLIAQLRAALADPETAAAVFGGSQYLPFVLDTIVSAINVIRSAETVVSGGASKFTVDEILREHLLGRMRREAALMTRLAELPVVELATYVGISQAANHDTAAAEA
jgi:hypothetical protein